MTERTNLPAIVLPAYLPFTMKQSALCVRAAILEQLAGRLLDRCQGNLRQLPINEASTVQDYMHARAKAGAW